MHLFAYGLVLLNERVTSQLEKSTLNLWKVGLLISVTEASLLHFESVCRVTFNVKCYVACVMRRILKQKRVPHSQ
jgi:hypothetical protein